MRTCSWLSPALFSEVPCCRVEGAASLQARASQSPLGLEAGMLWGNILGGDFDWQPRYTTGDHSKEFWTIGKNKIQNKRKPGNNNHSLQRAALTGCYLHRDRNTWWETKEGFLGSCCEEEVRGRSEQVAGGWVCSLTFPTLQKQQDDGKHAIVAAVHIYPKAEFFRLLDYSYWSSWTSKFLSSKSPLLRRPWAPQLHLHKQNMHFPIKYQRLFVCLVRLGESWRLDSPATAAFITST